MVSPQSEQYKALPPPWDRIFALGTRLFVWALLFLIVYLLRSFFLLIFLTFVFAYIQEHGVEALEHRIRNRPARVVLVATVFLGTLIAIGTFVVPHVREQAETFAHNYPKYLRDIDHAVNQFLEDMRPQSSEPVRRAAVPIAGPGDGVPLATGHGQESQHVATSTDGREVQPPATPSDGQEARIPPAAQHPRSATPGGQGTAVGRDAPPPQAQTQEPPRPRGEPIRTEKLIYEFLGLGDPGEGQATIDRAMQLLRTIATPLLAIGSAFLLSLLFSFLIVLDLPKLERGIKGLANTKVGFIYEEVADNIYTFGKVLGRALEAQLFIAILNTILTAIGLYFMGLPSIIFLSAIVFFCSFIPVAGVFISSTPICLVALQTGGFDLTLIAIGLILIIHFIEAYFLNPKIFGHHLRMNPVLVLIVLTIAGKLFHVWGLILALPVVNYFFSHAIRYQQRDPAVVLPSTLPPPVRSGTP